MSMPKLPNPNEILTKDEALNAILTSIALEEIALAKILTAESEKIEHATKSINPKDKDQMEMLLKINCSVSDVIEKLNDLQFMLKGKLRLVVGSMQCPKPCPPCPPPPKPPCPPPPPKPPCPPYIPPKPIYNYCKEFMKLPFPMDDFSPPQKPEFMEKGLHENVYRHWPL